MCLYDIQIQFHYIGWKKCGCWWEAVLVFWACLVSVISSPCTAWQTWLHWEPPCTVYPGLVFEKWTMELHLSDKIWSFYIDVILNECNAVLGCGYKRLVIPAWSPPQAAPVEFGSASSVEFGTASFLWSFNNTYKWWYYSIFHLISALSCVYFTDNERCPTNKKKDDIIIEPTIETMTCEPCYIFSRKSESHFVWCTLSHFL